MQGKRSWSISLKLWLAMTLLILVVLGSLGTAITLLFGDFYLQQKLDVLLAEAKEVAGELTASAEWTERLSMLQSVKLTSGSQLVVLNTAGEIIGFTGNPNASSVHAGAGWRSQVGQGGASNGTWGRPLRPTEFLTDQDMSKVLAGTAIAVKAESATGSGQTMLLAAAPIGSQPVQGVVMIVSSQAPIKESTNAFRRLIIYASLVAVALAAGLSLFIARQVTRPLALMQKAATRMAKGDFQPITGVSSNDELGQLAEALNSMGTSLQNHVTRLSQQKDLLEGIVGSMSDAVIMLGPDGRMLYANDPAKALWQENDVLCSVRQMGILGFLNSLVLESAEEKSNSTLTLGKQVLQAGIAPMSGEEGVRGHVAVLRDVTASLRAEKERRDFLASVTHELRTPLHLIQGYLEAIQDGVIPRSQQEEHIDLVLEEAKRLARLVRELQDINNLELGQALYYQPIDIAGFLEDLWQRFERRAQDAGINLEVVPFQGEVYADPDRIVQIFINLLDNAIRHTPPGNSVRVWVEDRGDMLKFAVQDEGEGMPVDALPHVFERFYRVDKSRSRKEGGMGLGLAIVKQITEAHGGTVRVESTLGQGTTFHINLPKGKFCK